MTQLPDAAEAAVVVLGNRTRVTILSSLAREGGATGAELQRRLGLLPNTVQTHLRVLEGFDVLVASPSRRDEPGSVIRRYEVDKKRMRDLMRALAALVT